MTSAELASSPAHAVGRLLARAWQAFRPPVSAVRFWIVQFGILSIALFDEAFLDELHKRLPFGVPDSATTGLLLVPVIYAALNFGRRGAVATALWATTLVVPSWVFIHHLSTGHFWIETCYLLVINSVAIVVGQRVENEQRARHRAEGALAAARSAEARYRGLFEEQPAPVIICDSAGTVTEINTAAMRLFGLNAAGSSLRELLTVSVAAVLTDDPPCLHLRNPAGEEELFIPTAHVMTSNDGTRLAQIVLTNVTEQHRRREEQQAFAGRLLAVQEEQRRRVAHELHDDPLQSLIFLTRELDDLSEDPELPARLTGKVLRNSAVATGVATSLRKVIRGLRPPILDDLGVVSALRQLAEESRTRSGLTIDLKIHGKATRLSPELELTVYRVVQESLSNVIRHAAAQRVAIRVRFGEQIVVTVTDDGCGIQDRDMTGDDSAGGFGLLGMRERVNVAGGALDVKPRRPHGTVVRATLPCVPPAAQPHVPPTAQPHVPPTAQPHVPPAGVSA
jgi:signal transduction histidine kinase